MFGFGRKAEGAKPSAFEVSVKWVATAGAAAFTFFAAAPLHETLQRPVEAYALAHYSEWVSWLSNGALWLLLVGLLFSSTRALLVGAITTAAMWVAARFS